MLKQLPVDQALTVNQVTGIGLATIVVVAVIGLTAALIITKLLARLVIAVVVVVLAVVVWTQRSAVVEAAQDAAQRCNASFFGVHVQSNSAAVRRACSAIRSR